MNFFKNLFSKSPEKYEQKADKFFDSKAYGSAKIEYENALNKLESQTNKDPKLKNPDLKKRLEDKIIKSKEALAQQHFKTGCKLMETDNYKDAEEIFHLALELTDNAQLASQIEKKIQDKTPDKDLFDNDIIPGLNSQTSENQEPEYQEQGEEYFTALCSTLSDKDRKAYFSYGESFQQGYIYLNQGDFEKAAELLLQAHQENICKESLIPLELATACMNLGNYEKAQSLLEDFLKHYPESIRAYGLLCEILWENNNFDHALHLIESCSQEISDSAEICLLKGETLYLDLKFQEAETHFLKYLQSCKWDENIAKALAKVYEARKLPEKALDIYAKLMNACQGCGHKPDPFLKQRYAEISLAAGDHSSKILELYLSLIQEDPENQAIYYQKVSQIYKLQGNDIEALRFETFAEKCQEK